jgi:nucleotide-binding universal stress UspA family protein
VADTAQVLVVANLGPASDELLAALQRRTEEGPAEFNLVVPATPHVPGIPDAAAPGIAAGEEQAEEYLNEALEKLRSAGLEVDGNVGDAEPLASIEDAVNLGSFDELIISGRSGAISRTVRLDLASKARASTGLQVRYTEDLVE